MDAWLSDGTFTALLPGLVGTACLYLFFSLRREISTLRRRCEGQQQTLDEAIPELRKCISELKASLEEAEQRAAAMVPPPPARSGMNLSKRTQVLRMFRHGEAPEKIAAALSLPQNEVKLLLKVHQMLVESI
jgi:hypothetical protein